MQTVELRNYLLQYLGKHVDVLNRELRDSLISTVAKITKLGWFVDQQHKDICNPISHLLQVRPLNVQQGIYGCSAHRAIRTALFMAPIQI